MREIIFDTETTGLNPAGGDRMVEIGCIELVNRVETGRTFHAYFNPDRPMPSDAEAVHGLTDIFLSDKPRFAELADQLLEFMGDSPLVAHNAGFDFGSRAGQVGVDALAHRVAGERADGGPQDRSGTGVAPRRVADGRANARAGQSARQRAPIGVVRAAAAGRECGGK